MKRRTSLLVASLVFALGVVAGASGGLTLEEVLSRALAEHPDLQAASAEVSAREGAALQAGLRPNPEASVEVEELFAARGGDALETTLALGQALELGGKRGKRRRAASLEAELARWDLASARQDLLAEARTTFFEALAAQERLAQAQALAELTDRGFRAVEERVDAGKVSPIERTQARVAVSSAQIELRRAQARWDAGRRRLAALWGGTGRDVAGLAGSLAADVPLAPEEELAAELARNPDLARRETETALRKAGLDAAHSLAVPDLTLSGGVRSVGAGDVVTGLVGVSLPLPLFDRNQGGIGAARAEVDRSRAEARAALLRLRAELAAAYQEAEGARAEALTLAERLLPDAEAAFEAVREGYRLGKFDLQRLLDAQRTVVEARTQLLDAQEVFRLAETRLARLTGRLASETPGAPQGAETR
ncbi:MAG: TolC family protein [Proteobacteria bacterium]|nr:TolC family protein [Pseudomonadota bacterium]